MDLALRNTSFGQPHCEFATFSTGKRFHACAHNAANCFLKCLAVDHGGSTRERYLALDVAKRKTTKGHGEYVSPLPRRCTLAHKNIHRPTNRLVSRHWKFDA